MKAGFHRSSCSVVAGKALTAAAFALAVGWGARGEAPGSAAYLQGGLVLQLDGIDNKLSNGATPHNLAPKGAVGFAPDEVRWFVPGTRLILK